MQDKHKKAIRIAAGLALIAYASKAYWLKQPDTDKKPAPVAAAVKVDTSRTLGSLKFKPCSLAQGTESLSAFCSTLTVPEDHSKPDGRKISLAVSWLPASKQTEEDPIFMLAGGPGQGARESFPSIAAAFTEARKTRHIILLDQRGTGDSHPLKCENTEGESAVVENEDYSAQSAIDFARKCAAVYAGKVDVRQFSTADAIRDLELARKAIGAAKINLIGISYGTRVAQQYAKTFPSSVRTVTIDGIAPLETVLGQEHAKNLEASLDLQFARCSQDKACLEKMGNPRAQLNQLLATLDKGPIPVRYRDAVSGEWRDGEFSAGHIAMLTRLLAYQPQAAALLPLQFSEANKGHVESLMALSEMVNRDVSDMIMHGMQLSVMCGEDAPDLVVDPEDRKRLLGTGLVELLQAQCAVWPHKQRPADFRQPLTGKLPVLILSGEFDPVTPPRYGDMVARHLPNSRHIIVKGAGHNVLPVGCMPKLFAKFLETADAKALDIGCIESLTYSPMFTGFYGSEP
ncbi:MAG: alpha/beta fold hydrolase [Arenimonas sp.]|nr:alpha/beta fold hydrolase [Arenimonas sp.]MBP7981626.1 alpha/beta fold hydrolase [Arenimonas sp.]